MNDEQVLIGCDGINSIVAEWLGFKKAAFSGRSAIRGWNTLTNNHDLESKFMQFFGKGFRMPIIPCDDKTVYWAFTWSPTAQGDSLNLSHNNNEIVHENNPELWQFI